MKNTCLQLVNSFKIQRWSNPTSSGWPMFLLTGMLPSHLNDWARIFHWCVCNHSYSKGWNDIISNHFQKIELRLRKNISFRILTNMKIYFLNSPIIIVMHSKISVGGSESIWMSIIIIHPFTALVSPLKSKHVTMTMQESFFDSLRKVWI